MHYILDSSTLQTKILVQNVQNANKINGFDLRFPLIKLALVSQQSVGRI